MGRHIEVIARGLVVRDSRILLCRNAESGYSFLPGGHVEFGEPAASALSREFTEETGLDVTVGELMHVSEELFEQGGVSRHEVNLVFHVARGSDWPSNVRSLESKIDFHWLNPSQLGSVDFRPDSTRDWLVSHLG